LAVAKRLALAVRHVTLELSARVIELLRRFAEASA
jgi:hypothetical protein